MAGMFLTTRRSNSSFYSSFALFFDLIFFSCQQPLEDSASPFGAVSSHIFPVRNFQGCQVAFSNIPETEQWTTYCTSAGSKLAVEEVLRNASIFHPRDVAQPSQSSSLQDCWQCCKAGAFQYLLVGNLVYPGNSKDTAKTAEMEAV